MLFSTTSGYYTFNYLGYSTQGYFLLLKFILL
jgi:hypothetical protein